MGVKRPRPGLWRSPRPPCCRGESCGRHCHVSAGAWPARAAGQSPGTWGLEPQRLMFPRVQGPEAQCGDASVATSWTGISRWPAASSEGRKTDRSSRTSSEGPHPGSLASTPRPATGPSLDAAPPGDGFPMGTWEGTSTAQSPALDTLRADTAEEVQDQAGASGRAGCFALCDISRGLAVPYPPEGAVRDPCSRRVARDRPAHRGM